MQFSEFMNRIMQQCTNVIVAAQIEVKIVTVTAPELDKYYNMLKTESSNFL
jgi:hypothetical protein